MDLHTMIGQIPVPRDLPLPLPLPHGLMVFLLVVSFLLHIVFVNLMVGGSIVALWSELKGRKDPDYDTLAYEIAKTITVNKSLAVVLGVAPLLTINALYTLYFYSANALTGLFWIAIIPLVTLAFLLTYAHKYSWNVLRNNKPLHITLLGMAVAIFLFIPFIFLTNINLMLFPEKWNTIQGFSEALLLPNVFPRYLHFVFASLGITGLFIFWYFGRQGYPFEEHFKRMTRYELRKKAYSLTFAASIIQFMIGPVVLLTLPTQGMSWKLVLTIGTGAVIALPAVYWIWKGVTGEPEHIDRHFWKVTSLLTITVIFMGSGRHLYRATALAPHQKLVAEETRKFQAESKKAAAQQGKVKVGTQSEAGEAIFTSRCSACHAREVKVVGPPVKEMIQIYQNDLAGLQDWIRKPGKKRPDSPQMPALGLSDSEVREVADYILRQK